MNSLDSPLQAVPECRTRSRNKKGGHSITKKLFRGLCLCSVLFFVFPWGGSAQDPSAVEPAPPRSATEGRGPFPRLIIRGVTVIDGTGAPPQEPMDVVIEGNRIVEVVRVGYPSVPTRETHRPGGATEEIDASGMYLLPGFVDTHGHVGGGPQGVSAEYVYKLWMAHGVTTVREAGADNGLEWTLSESRRSSANEIVAPRLVVYTRPGSGWDGPPIRSPGDARQWVRSVAEIEGVSGLKLYAEDPPIMAALIDEAERQGLGTMAHVDRVGVARMTMLEAAKLGLGSAEHVLGLFESLFEHRTVPDLPGAYRPEHQQMRFRETGRLSRQAAPSGSRRWRAVMDTMLSEGIALTPTLAVYDVARDVSRARWAEWHDEYTLPSLWSFFQPSPETHAAFYFDWTNTYEVEWRENFDLWMAFLEEYKNRGGRVTAGSDAGWMYNLYGFTFIRELELLEEAGFHPLEVIRSATLWGAELIGGTGGAQPDFGLIRPGMLADLVLVEENPVENLKVLYGTGHLRLNPESGKAGRVGGVRYTIKDGIVYDAKRLLADVRGMVEAARAEDPEGGRGPTD